MKLLSSIKKGGVSLTASLDTGSFPKFRDNLKKFMTNPRGSNTAQAVKIGADMLNAWGNGAKSKLKSAESYISALEEGNQPEYEGDPLQYKITQGQKTKDGKRSLAMILEHGIEPFDMKEKILKGRRKVVIKFEYGSPSQSRSTPLPKEIYNLMRAKVDKDKTVKVGNSSFSKYTLYHSHVKMMYGDEAANKFNPQREKFFTMMPSTSSNLPGKAQGIRTGSGRFAFSVAYKWKTREFEGLKAEVTQSGSRKEVSKFSVFRTISANSDPHSWIHPGIIPKYIFRDAVNNHIPKIRPILQQALELDLNPQ